MVKGNAAMKNQTVWYIALVFWMLWAPPLLMAQVPAQRVASVVTQATVYPQGARIHRQATARLQRGRQRLRFDGLTRGLDPETIQCDAQGAFTLISVSFQTEKLDSMPMTAYQKALEDSLERLSDSVAYLKARLDGLEEEKNMLRANRDIGGEQKILLYEDVYEMAVFFRKRFRQISESQHEIQKRQSSIQRRLEAVKRRQRQLQQKRKKASGVVEVLVEASRPGNARFELRYYTPLASWKPEYDFLFSGLEKPVTMRYKAQVRQNTGVDWQDIPLQLTAQEPNQRLEPPQLRPWKLPPQPRPAPAYNRSMSKSENNRLQGAADEAAALAPAERLSASVTQRKLITSRAFEISRGVAVPSDQQFHTLDLDATALKADYRYQSTPKLQEDAFLMARIPDWRTLNLLPGQANMFIEDVYVGKTPLRPEQIGDTLELGFGPDQAIGIEYLQLQDFRKKTFFGGNIRQQMGYEIKIKNRRAAAITILVQDQIPVSTQEDIEVELTEDSKGDHNPRTGIIRWMLQPDAGASESHILRYEVKYPADKDIF